MDTLNVLVIAMAAGAFILALVSFLIYRKLGINKVLSLLISLATALVLGNIFFRAALECDRYISIKTALEHSLSPTDFTNIKPNRFICPSEYSYTRNGKKEWAIDYGDGVMFIDENHLP